MKASLTILLSGLLLCGCSKKPATTATPAAQAIDSVKSHTSVTWNDDYELTVEQRDGAALGIIEVVHRKPNGQGTAIQAVKGTVEPEGASAVKITLFNATIVTRTVISRTNDVVVVLQKGT